MHQTSRIGLIAIVTGLVGGVVGCVNQVEDEGGVMGSFGAGGEDTAVDEEALTAKCAAGSTVKGIDVSYYQGDIDWSRVDNSGVKYAFIRVSDGTGFRDSKFDRNWSGAKSHGIMRGAYQFFRSNQDPVAQADILISKVGGHLGPDDLPPVIDVESSDGQSAHTIATKVRRWLDRIHEKLGVNGIVYTGPYFWQDSVGNADLSSHPLWVAHYGTSCPLVPGAWRRWTFHQFTSSGSISGISGGVDTNHFNGSLADLKKLLAGPDIPRACETGHFHGEFCDDDNSGDEAEHDTLVRQLGVNFHCTNINGHAAFCGGKDATRSQTAFVLLKAAGVPLAGHDNAFRDDNDDAHEAYFNAAQDFGIFVGNSQHEVNPDGIATRNQLATVLFRMYKLPNVTHDYFYDDDGDADEHIHNAVAAAGLMTGYDDASHVRNKFKGTDKATRSTLAVLAVRAHNKGLIPVWDIPNACLSGNFTGAFCDDDNGSGAQGRDDDRLANELNVNFDCGKLAGAPAYCPSRPATRAQSMFVLGKAAGIPLAGHDDAFDDDDNNQYERYLNAAQDFGIMVGFSGHDVKPGDIATRDTVATILARMYKLPATTTDYFTDDDGAADEDLHNKVAEAGLFSGFDDGHGGRKFDGARKATRGTLATLAVRAHDNPLLVPLWLLPSP